MPVCQDTRARALAPTHPPRRRLLAREIAAMWVGSRHNGRDPTQRAGAHAGISPFVREMRRHRRRCRGRCCRRLRRLRLGTCSQRGRQGRYSWPRVPPKDEEIKREKKRNIRKERVGAGNGGPDLEPRKITSTLRKMKGADDQGFPGDRNTAVRKKKRKSAVGQ